MNSTQYNHSHTKLFFSTKVGTNFITFPEVVIIVSSLCCKYKNVLLRKNARDNRLYCILTMACPAWGKRGSPVLVLDGLGKAGTPVLVMAGLGKGGYPVLVLAGGGYPCPKT